MFRDNPQQFRDRGRLFRYGVALLVTGLSLLLRWPMWPLLGNQTPHMTFFPAVMLSAYFGGFWALTRRAFRASCRRNRASASSALSYSRDSRTASTASAPFKMSTVGFVIP